MNGFRCAVLMFCVSIASAARAQDAGITEIVPTARREAVTWRYTFERPADDWSQPAFDDRAWQTAPAPFGAPNTPGVNPKTRWSTCGTCRRT